MVMEEDSLFKMVNERLRAQQRALRQSRRARPFDLRTGRVTRRTQQEARRKGISPIFLQQQKEQEKARKEQIRKIRKHYREVLTKLKEVPAVLQQEIANIPLEHRKLLSKDLLDVEKARKQRRQKFQNRIKNLERREAKYKDKYKDTDRERTRNAYIERYDEVRAEARELRKLINQENISYKDAQRYARRVANMRGKDTRRRLQAKTQTRVQVTNIPATTIGGFSNNSPEINIPGQLGGVLLTPQEAARRQTSKNSKESQSILDGLAKIFGF